VTNTASDVGVTANTIKVGGYFILSGPLYDLAGKDPHRLWQSAIRYYNDAGGVNGRRYVANPIDSQIDCGPGMASLRKAVEQDKIFAIAGSFNPYLTPCAGSYLEAGGIPSLPSDNIDPSVLKYKTTFGVGTTHYRYARIGVRYALNEMGAQSVSVVTHSDKLMDSVEQGAKEVAGGRLKSIERVAYDEANLAPLVQRLRASGPDALYIYLNPDRVILLLQEMERQGYRPPKGIMGGASMVLDLVPQYVGKFAEGINGMSWVAATDSGAPGIKEIQTAVARYAPDAHIDQYSAGGYAAFRLFHNVVKSLGANVTRKGVIDRLNNLTNFDNAGLEPPLSYRPDDREANRCMQIVTVRESKWRFVKDWVCDQ
jgi:branched-chain amino acid transport system substrate-binding protein